METKKYASNPSELYAMIAEDYGIINRTALKKTVPNTFRTPQHKRIQKLIEELKNDIESGLNRYYASYTPVEYKRRSNGLKSGLFEGVEYDEESRTAYIRFAGNAWVNNAVKSDPHMSFTPVLINYGWKSFDRNPSNKRRSSGEIRDFNYYAGNHFISDAIEKFNLKCANENIQAQAKFVVNGMDVETLFSNGGIPYRK